MEKSTEPEFINVEIEVEQERPKFLSKAHEEAYYSSLRQQAAALIKSWENKSRKGTRKRRQK